LDRALSQIPAELVERLEILVRADSAGATHETADHCDEGNMRFSFGYELTETVRAAILQTAEDAWIPALDQDGSVRENGEVSEITDRLELSSWPEGSRLIVRRERPHPGAQLSFTDHDGYRFQAILTDQTDADIAVIERRHRQRARVEDRIRDDKDTGLRKFPFKDFAHNEVWLQIVLLAHDLIVWTQTLLLSGELQKAEPKRLRYRLLHVAARLALSPHAKRSCTSSALGPGPPSSSPPSRSSKRSQPPPADRSAGNPRQTTKTQRHGASEACPPTGPNPREKPGRTRSQPPQSATNAPDRSTDTAPAPEHPNHTVTERSGLGPPREPPLRGPQDARERLRRLGAVSAAWAT
jgi:Transposase DDE domain group 1